MCEVALYESAVEKVIEALADDACVESIFQIGDVRHPGISDIDLLVIVDDAGRSIANPLDRLSVSERRLFTHGCFALPRSLVYEIAPYLPFRNYRPLRGASWLWPHELVSLPNLVATEFLVRNLLDVYVQLEYRIIKVRSLLQHIKAMRVDLEMLEIAGAELGSLVDDVVERVDEWFIATPPSDYVAEIATRLLGLLRDTVSGLTQRESLCCPTGSEIAIGTNMKIVNNSGLRLRRSGVRVRIPAVRGLEDRLLFNANHRVNSFTVGLPLRPARSDEWDRFELFRRAKWFVQSHLPTFTAPISPLFYYDL